MVGDRRQLSGRSSDHPFTHTRCPPGSLKKRWWEPCVTYGSPPHPTTVAIDISSSTQLVLVLQTEQGSSPTRSTDKVYQGRSGASAILRPPIYPSPVAPALPPPRKPKINGAGHPAIASHWLTKQTHAICAAARQTVAVLGCVLGWVKPSGRELVVQSLLGARWRGKWANMFEGGGFSGDFSIDIATKCGFPPCVRLRISTATAVAGVFERGGGLVQRRGLLCWAYS